MPVTTGLPWTHHSPSEGKGRQPAPTPPGLDSMCLLADPPPHSGEVNKTFFQPIDLLPRHIREYRAGKNPDRKSRLRHFPTQHHDIVFVLRLRIPSVAVQLQCRVQLLGK